MSTPPSNTTPGKQGSLTSQSSLHAFFPNRTGSNVTSPSSSSAPHSGASPSHQLGGGVALLPTKSHSTSPGAQVAGGRGAHAISHAASGQHHQPSRKPSYNNSGGSLGDLTRRPSHQQRHQHTPCKYFMSTGVCKYGSKCSYSHNVLAQQPPRRQDSGNAPSSHQPSPQVAVVTPATTADQQHQQQHQQQRVVTSAPSDVTSNPHRSQRHRHQDVSPTSSSVLPTVVLPWDPSYSFKGNNGKRCRHWDSLLEVLQEHTDIIVATSQSLPTLASNNSKQHHSVLVPLWVELLRSVQPFKEVCTSMAGLEGALYLLTASEIVYFSSTVLPWMQALMLRAETSTFSSTGEESAALFGGGPDTVPLLVNGSPGKRSFTQEQSALLLVCSFLSLFPYRTYKIGASGQRQTRHTSRDARNEVVPFTGPRGRDGYGRTLGSMNMASLFAAHAHGGGASSSAYTAPTSLQHTTSTAFAEDGMDAPVAPPPPHPDSSIHNKVLCIIHYFMSLCKGWGNATLRSRRIEIIRCVLPEAKVAGIFTSASQGDTTTQASSLMSSIFSGTGSGGGMRSVQFDSELLIEKASGLMQADFANACLGGGVLGRGCVQEEIRFVVCPDMFVARLVCENLAPTEAILINGCEQYCDYYGYGKSFAVRSSIPDATTTTTTTTTTNTNINMVGGVANVCITAIDATNYNSTGLRPEFQFRESWIKKDLHKALVGFNGSIDSTLPSGQISSSSAIATGHWGCGAFGGDRELKFITQWIAASLVGRDMVYCTFGDIEFINRCQAFCDVVSDRKPIELLSAVLAAGGMLTNLYEDGLASFPLGNGVKHQWQPSTTNATTTATTNMVEEPAEMLVVEGVAHSQPQQEVITISTNDEDLSTTCLSEATEEYAFVPVASSAPPPTVAEASGEMVLVTDTDRFLERTLQQLALPIEVLLPTKK